MKTDNELIHEFMGEDWKTGTWEWGPGRTRPMVLNDLDHYQKSWNWLMPVVERISENYDFTIQFYDGECNCFCTKQTADGSDIPGVGHGGFTPKIESV